MRTRLREKGQAVTGHDRDVTRSDTASPSACAAPLVLFSLPDAAAVGDVLAALLPAMPRGGVVVDTSTLGPAAARAFAAVCAAAGVTYLDAPISGGTAGALAGTLAMMVGGPFEGLERVRPALCLLASRIHHVGQAAGAGQVAKLANNLLVAAHLVAAAEALRIAEAAGVPPAALLPVLNAASGRSAATEVNWPRWIMNDSFDSGFTAGLMRKDVRLAMDMAAALGQEPSICGAAARAWADSAVPDSADFNLVAAKLAAS